MVCNDKFIMRARHHHLVALTLVFAAFVWVAISPGTVSAEDTWGRRSPTCPPWLDLNIGYGSSDISYDGYPVALLQRFLLARGYMTASSTGYFGVLTREAVRKFQLEYGIPATGYVGPLTRAKIQEQPCPRPRPL